MNKKIKKFLHKFYLNKAMNYLIIFTAVFIAFIHIYLINEEWVKTNLAGIYDLISNNYLISSLIVPCIPTVLSFILPVFIKKIKNKRKQTPILFSNETHNNSIFPRLITPEMIRNHDVTFIEKKKVVNDAFDENQENEDKPGILDRQEQCNNIINIIESFQLKANTLNCLYVTGSSGAGKSILLCYILKNKLEEMHKSCVVFREKYSDGDYIYNYIKNINPEIVIMDQFERSLDNIGVFEKIKQLVIENSRILFIFSFPQEVFDKVHMKLADTNDNEKKQNIPMQYVTYFIHTDKHDVEQIQKMVKDFIGNDKDIEKCLEECVDACESNKTFMSAVESYEIELVFLCSILARIKTDKAPLVEFSILSYIYERFHSEINANIGKYIDDPNQVIKMYLSEWTDRFYHPETGQMILYLLSDNKNYSIEDLKLITFESDEYFNINSQEEQYDQSCNNIIDAIKSNVFISINAEQIGFDKAIGLVHDYLGDKVRNFCFNNLSSEIRHNIDNYRNNVIFSKVKKQEIRNHYNMFHSGKYKIFVNLCVIIISIFSIFFNIYKGMQATTPVENMEYILLAISAFAAIYYMYNIVIHFFVSLPLKHYFCIVVFGVILIVLCPLFPKFWGIFIGCELMTLGFSLAVLRNKTIGTAKIDFTKRGRLYASLGLIIVLLGLLYLYNLIPYYVIYHCMFILYTFFSCIMHANYSFSIILIGMANTIKD